MSVSRVNLIDVRKLARLVLFFSLSFAILFLAMAGMRFLVLRLEWIRAVSDAAGIGQADSVAAARWALSFALYGGIFLGLVYAIREKIFAPAAILCIAVLSMILVVGIGQGLENWSNVPAGAERRQSLGDPGLILANPVRPYGTAIVLLQGPDETARARVVAVPGSPMVFQEEFAGTDRSLVNLPPALFNSDSPWFLRSIAIDLRLSAENLRNRLAEGWPSFLLYAFALVFLLSSLMFVFRFSVWPLANFFLGVLAFRGVLALETLLNSREIQDVFASFLQYRLPLSLVVPFIFIGAGLLAHLYSAMVHFARRHTGNAVV